MPQTTSNSNARNKLDCMTNSIPPASPIINHWRHVLGDKPQLHGILHPQCCETCTHKHQQQRELDLTNEHLHRHANVHNTNKANHFPRRCNRTSPKLIVRIATAQYGCRTTPGLRHESRSTQPKPAHHRSSCAAHLAPSCPQHHQTWPDQQR